MQCFSQLIGRISKKKYSIIIHLFKAIDSCPVLVPLHCISLGGCTNIIIYLMLDFSVTKATLEAAALSNWNHLLTSVINQNGLQFTIYLKWFTNDIIADCNIVKPQVQII